MPTTTNYGWVTPTEGGSTGTWDTILNDAIESIDANLKAVEDKADEALAENVLFPLLAVNARGLFLGAQADDDSVRGVGGITLLVAGSLDYIVPITGLVPGMQITGFKSRGQSSNGTSLNVSVSIQYIDATGASTVVGSHTHSDTLATLTKSGLAHTVVADRDYFFTIILHHGGTGSGASIVWVQPTVTRA